MLNIFSLGHLPSLCLSFVMFVFERERGITESEADSRLWAVSTEPNLALELWDHDLSWSQVLTVPLEVSTFDKIQFILFFFFFLFWAMFLVLAKFLSDPRSQGPVFFFPRSVVFLALTLGPFWVKFYMWYEVRMLFSFCLCMFISFSTISWKHCPYCIKLTRYLCWKSVDHIREVCVLFCWCTRSCVCQMCCLDSCSFMKV